jgi:hypothetical protein
LRSSGSFCRESLVLCTSLRDARPQSFVLCPVFLGETRRLDARLDEDPRLDEVEAFEALRSDGCELLLIAERSSAQEEVDRRRVGDCAILATSRVKGSRGLDRQVVSTPDEEGHESTAQNQQSSGHGPV